MLQVQSDVTAIACLRTLISDWPDVNTEADKPEMFQVWELIWEKKDKKKVPCDSMAWSGRAASVASLPEK